MSEQITLETIKDGETMEVDKEIAMKSEVIKGIIGDFGFEVVVPIPIPNIKKPILKKVIDYCTHIHQNPPPEIKKPLDGGSNFNDVVSIQYNLSCTIHFWFE